MLPPDFSRIWSGEGPLRVAKRDGCAGAAVTSLLGLLAMDSVVTGLG